MKNKICLPLIAAMVLVGLPSTSFARWLPAHCADVSTDPYLKDQHGKLQTPSKDATFEIGCYNASGELVRRVMHYSVLGEQHWSISEEPLGTGGKIEAYMQTSAGKTFFVVAAVGASYLVGRAVMATNDRVVQKFRTSESPASIVDSVADTAGLEPQVRGPRPRAFSLLDPAKLNVDYTQDPIVISKLVLSADVIPAGLKWRTYEGGSRWIIQRQRVPGVAEIQPGTAYEAIRIDTTTSGVRTAPEGDWASTPWTKETFEVLADPAELQATYRPEPVVEVPPATFAIPGEAEVGASVPAEAPKFSDPQSSVAE